VKLLLDQNLSPHLVSKILDLFPQSTHVRDLNLQSASDPEVWSYAANHNYVILSKDADFHQMSFLYGPPPKVVWIRRGNCSTSEILKILRGHVEDLVAFDENSETAFLTLE